MKRRRLPPMPLNVPVYDGPVEKNADAREENRSRRNLEIRTAQGGKRNQSLSIELAALYRRNVYAAGGLPLDTWMEAPQSCIGPTHKGLPSRDFLIQGEFVGLAVSWDVAENLLDRDGKRRSPWDDSNGDDDLMVDENVLRMLARR